VGAELDRPVHRLEEPVMGRGTAVAAAEAEPAVETAWDSEVVEAVVVAVVAVAESAVEGTEPVAVVSVEHSAGSTQGTADLVVDTRREEALDDHLRSSFEALLAAGTLEVLPSAFAVAVAYYSCPDPAADH
jgi:hypothetical protein